MIDDHVNSQSLNGCEFTTTLPCERCSTSELPMAGVHPQIVFYNGA